METTPLQSLPIDEPAVAWAPAVKSDTPLRVLVVDDEPLVRWSIAEALRAQGHRVAEASDAASTLRALLEWPFDALLLDYRLPDSHDLHLLGTLRQLVPGLAVVIMTAYPTEELLSRARLLGASDILEKPFDIFGVERVLLDACGHRSRQ